MQIIKSCWSWGSRWIENEVKNNLESLSERVSGLDVDLEVCLVCAGMGVGWGGFGMPTGEMPMALNMQSGRKGGMEVDPGSLTLLEDMTNSLCHLEPSTGHKKIAEMVTAALRRHGWEEDEGGRGRKTQESQLIPPTVFQGEGVGTFLLQVPACTKLLLWAVDLQSRALVAGDSGVELRVQTNHTGPSMGCKQDNSD